MAYETVSVVKAVMHGWVWPVQCNAKRVVCTEYLKWVWTTEDEGGTSSGPKQVNWDDVGIAKTKHDLALRSKG